MLGSLAMTRGKALGWGAMLLGGLSMLACGDAKGSEGAGSGGSTANSTTSASTGNTGGAMNSISGASNSVSAGTDGRAGSSVNSVSSAVSGGGGSPASSTTSAGSPEPSTNTTGVTSTTGWVIEPVDDCEPHVGDNGSHCQLTQLCQGDLKVAECIEQTDGWLCVCSDPQQQFLVEPEFAENACETLQDWCGGTEIPRQGDMSCVLDAAVVNPSYCNGGFTCTESGAIDDVPITLLNFGNVYCSVDDKGTWSCFCSFFGDSERFVVDAEDSNDACPKGVVRCPEFREELSP